MIGKLVVVIPALVVLIAADTSGAQARSNAGAMVGPSQSSVKPHGAAKVKTSGEKGIPAIRAGSTELAQLRIPRLIHAAPAGSAEDARR
jgi:hypothetical protein